MLHRLNPMGLLESINGPLQDLWLTRAGGVRPVETPQFGRWFQSLLRSSRRLKPQISHGFLAPFEGFPDASPGVLQGTRIKATKGGVCIERTSEIMWKSINGPLQDLWLTRAGGVRPVGTPQFRRLYPRPPTKCLPANRRDAVLS